MDHPLSVSHGGDAPVTRPAAAIRRPRRPRPPRATAALAALSLAALAAGALGGARAAAARARQDAPPTAALARGGADVPGRLGTHVWGGLAVDYVGIMSPREPWEGPSAATATLALGGIDDAPRALAATWYDVSDVAPVEVGDDWAAWRPDGRGAPALGVRPALTQAITLPATAGTWLLHVFGDWDGPGRGDVSWGWLLRVPPADEVELDGLYAGGFEQSAFISGTVGCPNPPDAWWLVDPDGTFNARYREALSAQAGVPIGYGNYTPVAVRVRGVVSPPGRHGHLGAYPRAFTVTALVDMSPTLRCGLDVPDVALQAPWYDFACAPDGFARRLRFTVANLGSRTLEPPLAIVAHGAGGAVVERFDAPLPLAPGARATVEWTWPRGAPSGDPRELVAERAAERPDRYAENDRVAIPLITMTPPPCATPTSTGPAPGEPTATATDATPEGPTPPATATETTPGAPSATPQSPGASATPDAGAPTATAPVPTRRATIYCPSAERP